MTEIIDWLDFSKTKNFFSVKNNVKRLGRKSQLGTAQIRNTDCAGEDVEQRGPPLTAHGSAEGCGHFGGQFGGFSQK